MKSLDEPTGTGTPSRSGVTYQHFGMVTDESQQLATQLWVFRRRWGSLKVRLDGLKEECEHWIGIQCVRYPQSAVGTVGSRR